MGFACLKNFKQYVSFVSICLRCLNDWLSLKGRDNMNSFPEALPSAVRSSIIIRAALFPWLRLSQRLIVSLFRLIGSKIAVIVSTFYIGVDGIFSQSPRIRVFVCTHAFFHACGLFSYACVHSRLRACVCVGRRGRAYVFVDVLACDRACARVNGDQFDLARVNTFA